MAQSVQEIASILHHITSRPPPSTPFTVLLFKNYLIIRLCIFSATESN